MIKKTVFGFGVAMTALLTGTVLWFWAHDLVGDHSQSVALQKAVQPYLTPRRASFSLVDHTGQAVTEETYKGRMLLVYFGYTSCAEVCPTDLSTMIRALDILGEPTASRIQPIFITLDPRRDTVDHLAQYMELFHPRLQGLTGTPAEVRQVAREYGVYYYAGEVQGTYVVDHTAYTYLIDPEGRHLAYFEHGTDPADMAAVLGRQITSPQQLYSSNRDASL